MNAFCQPAPSDRALNQNNGPSSRCRFTNSLAGAFSVEFTTNLTDWHFLGPATPRYLFTDTNAPAEPQRYYRLLWP